MKQPTGQARPRRASPKAASKKKGAVRLDLKRRPTPPEPEQVMERSMTTHFWRWVVFIALVHVFLVVGLSIYFAFTTPATAPVNFISLLPEGDVVKGNPGQQQAHKVAPTTTASIAHHATKPPPTAPAVPKAVTPPVKPPPPPPKLSETAIEKAVVKPPAPKVVKPTPPKTPKVKVDLSLADGPVTPPDKAKPKLHAKKPVLRSDDSAEDNETETRPNSTGLSKEQVAQKLGDKLDTPGTKNAVKTGASGSTNAHSNDYSGFYALVRDQVMNNWTAPNRAQENAVNPVVQIYVEKDGRVPPESVKLIQSSGDSTFDDSAVAAAKSLGYLHEPLPDGCNPVMSINFKLTR